MLPHSLRASKCCDKMTSDSIGTLDEEVKNKILDSVDPPKSAVSFLFHENEHYDWVGIYVLCGDELVLGPFYGPPTQHTRISMGKGICGAAVREQRTINLPDVWTDERFIACSSTTRSELVVPVWFEDTIIGELDIDSNTPAAFAKADEQLVKEVGQLIAPYVKDLVEKLS